MYTSSNTRTYLPVPLLPGALRRRGHPDVRTLHLGDEALHARGAAICDAERPKEWSFGFGKDTTSEMCTRTTFPTTKLITTTTQVMFLEMGGDVSRWLSLTLFGTISHSNSSFSSSSMSLTLILTQAPSALPSPLP